MKTKKSKKKLAILKKIAYFIGMNKEQLNQKFERLHRQVNALWDSSKSFQNQSAEYKQAWQDRFEVSRELRNFRDREERRTVLGVRDAHPLNVDAEFRFREQNAGVFNEK